MNKYLANKIFLAINKLFAVSIFLLLVTACGAPKKYAIDSPELSMANSGIVLGKVTQQRFYGLFQYNADSSFGRGLSFKNKNTGEEFSYRGAYYFEMRLPEGMYQITGMGTPNGGIIPKDEPFEFTVKNGEIKYIGSIVADRDLERYLSDHHIEKPILGKDIYSVKDYGEIEIKGLLQTPTGRAKAPFFTFFIIDEHDEVIDQFKTKYPSLGNQNVLVGFIK